SHSSVSNGAMNATEGGASGGACSSASSSASTRRLPRIPSTSTGTSAPEPTVGAVPGQELVPELFSLRHLVREHLGREQPFEKVVVPAVAVAPLEADRARDGVGLEHGAHGVLGHAEPILRRTVLPLEVE